MSRDAKRISGCHTYGPQSTAPGKTPGVTLSQSSAHLEGLLRPLTMRHLSRRAILLPQSEGH